MRAAVLIAVAFGAGVPPTWGVGLATDLAGQTALFVSPLRLAGMPEADSYWIRWRAGETLSGRRQLGQLLGLSADGNEVFYQSTEAAGILDWTTGEVRAFSGHMISRNGRWLVNQETGERIDRETNARRATGLSRPFTTVTDNGQISGTRDGRHVLWSEQGETALNPAFNLQFLGSTWVSPDGKYQFSSSCTNCMSIGSPPRRTSFEATLLANRAVTIGFASTSYLGTTRQGHWILQDQNTGVTSFYDPASATRRTLPSGTAAADVGGYGSVTLALDGTLGLTRLNALGGAVELIAPRSRLVVFSLIMAPGSLKTLRGAGLQDAAVRFALNSQPLEVVTRGYGYVQLRVPPGLRYGRYRLEMIGSGSRSPFVGDAPATEFPLLMRPCDLQFADPLQGRPVPDAEGQARLRISGLGPAEFIEHKLRALAVGYGAISARQGFQVNRYINDLPFRELEPGLFEVTFPFLPQPFEVLFGECTSATIP